MPFVYREVDQLWHKPRAGPRTCADLVRDYVPGLKGLPTTAWRAGVNVTEAGSKVVKGTAIAAFANGRYPGRDHDNRAAIVLQVMGPGIWVMDQWADDKHRLFIERPLIRSPAPHKQRKSRATARSLSRWLNHERSRISCSSRAGGRRRNGLAVQEWRLDGGGLLHGAPDKSGYLKPYDVIITKKGDREIGIRRWKLGPLPHFYQTWLYCSYGAAGARFETLQSLVDSVDVAADPKAAADLANRINAENAMMQNEITKLNMLAMIHNAQEKQLAQQGRESIAKLGKGRPVYVNDF